MQVVHRRVGGQREDDPLGHRDHKLVVSREYDVHAVDDHLLGLCVHVLV